MMVSQKKVPGQVDESVIANITVIKKAAISTTILQTIRVVKLPL